MQFRRVCHDTLPWLISFSLDDMTPHMKVTPFILVVAVLSSACQTTTQTTNRIAVGMTEAEVLRAVGPPFSKSAEERDGATVEKWIYKETTWDQGGWSWNRTVSDSAVIFRNGRVVSYGVEKERHLRRAPGDINVNVSHDE
jgi:hypothetical protein